MRFRVIALPIFFVTVKPNLALEIRSLFGNSTLRSLPRASGDVKPRGRASMTKDIVLQRAPPRIRRNSARFLSVSIGGWPARVGKNLRR